MRQNKIDILLRLRANSNLRETYLTSSSLRVRYESHITCSLLGFLTRIASVSRVSHCRVPTLEPVRLNGRGSPRKIADAAGTVISTVKIACKHLPSRSSAVRSFTAVSYLHGSANSQSQLQCTSIPCTVTDMPDGGREESGIVHLGVLDSKVHRS
ncbi:hypothetical protein OBBRIDRAFT_28396 [Obba rivulosa]|uniref:Uncharacterized protein n=1 Tax=Obba rivulosa TaxID=1052685 RepID=A0A8E2AWH4_9APHY|nr:hypothetical protein OBBRIDRAFT_28396 [Obba rivulosa]